MAVTDRRWMIASSIRPTLNRIGNGEHFSNVCVRLSSPIWPSADVVREHLMDGSVEIPAYILKCCINSAVICPSHSNFNSQNQAHHLTALESS